MKLFALALALGAVSAWWDYGHMFVARIAYDHLLETNPSIVSKVEQTLQPMSYFNEHEQNHTFVECATFADDIKLKGGTDQSAWHIVLQPYFRDNFTADVPAEQYNLTWAINNMIDSLSQNKTDNDTGVSWIFGDSINTRLLIHYVGDIH
mmetsp:Transcript_32932/g.50356  ORF Transcript_32932/g.50356 Transcript_32932/m.50356 type:complete len:150 (-) Transcript_32932:503-952(-)